MHMNLGRDVHGLRFFPLRRFVAVRRRAAAFAGRNIRADVHAIPRHRHDIIGHSRQRTEKQDDKTEKKQRAGGGDGRKASAVRRAAEKKGGMGLAFLRFSILAEPG
jgi:hypothetical protein